MKLVFLLSLLISFSSFFLTPDSQKNTSFNPLWEKLVEDFERIDPQQDLDNAEFETENIFLIVTPMTLANSSKKLYFQVSTPWPVTVYLEPPLHPPQA